MFKKLPLLFIAIILAGVGTAQDHEHWCGTDQFYKAEAEKHPEAYRQAEQKLDQFIVEYASSAMKKDDGRTYYIPVVFHYIHNEQAPEKFFGADQAAGVLKRLNEDFSATNPDTDKIQDYYKDLRGNPNIQFLLAEKDEQGNSHSGINYVKTKKTKASNRTTDSEAKSFSSWSSKKYLNFWIVESLSEEGVLAFATFPEFSASGRIRASEDGVIGLLSLFATTIGEPFRRHALSHEVGHWLSLRHPFQGDEGDEDGCSQLPCKFGGDRICDIAQVDRPRNGECTPDETTCPADPDYPNRPDNRTNIMDYRDCPQMFSKDQVERMRGTLLGHRHELVSWANLNATGVADRIENRVFVKTALYSNPFSGHLSVDIQVAHEGEAIIRISDVLGRTTYTLNDVALDEGINHLELDANSMQLPNAGVYFLEIKLEDARLVRRIQYSPNK